MSQLIIFKQDNGSVAVIYPIEEYVEKYGIDAIAKKDVPDGKPYKIINAADLPADRTKRDAWTVDIADLTDGVGGVYNEFEENQNEHN